MKELKKAIKRPAFCVFSALIFFFSWNSAFVSVSSVHAQTTGSLIKMVCDATTEVNDPCRAVYYYNRFGERQPFPNEKIFFSWYTNFDAVVTISDHKMASIPLTGSVTYKPGVRMVKFPSAPPVYTVGQGSVLQEIKSESVAEALYGSTWNQQIDDISEAFFSHYSFGDLISTSGDFDREAEQSIETIDDNISSSGGGGSSSSASNTSSTTDDAEVSESSVTNIFSGASFYVDPYSNARNQVTAWNSSRPADASALELIASQPAARWFGDWNSDIQASVDRYVSTVTDTGALPVLVAYNIPNRDCGNYSAGGSKDAQAYLEWITAFAAGVGSRTAVIVLEPDATSISCVDDAQLTLLGEAVRTLKSESAAFVYIDAGHDNWIDVETMAARLQLAGIADADGFALNISNFYTTEENVHYGTAVSELVDGKHFLIDTSRNGNGWNGEWCNPSGRKIGATPTMETGNSLVDAWLWIKPPGESDGTCNGGPSAGAWWPEYALGLV